MFLMEGIAEGGTLKAGKIVGKKKKTLVDTCSPTLRSKLSLLIGPTESSKTEKLHL